MLSYVLDVALAHIRPKIWRQLRVPGDLSLAELHDVLQLAFGWEDYHLHEFRVGQQRYGVPDPEEPNDDLFDDLDATVASALPHRSSTMQYIYDFGDDWIHNVSVHRIDDAAPSHRPHSRSAPVACLAGKRCAPPEDCGGPPGYRELLDAIGNAAHPRHAELLEWVGGAFDPEAFSLRDVNSALVSLR